MAVYEAYLSARDLKLIHKVSGLINESRNSHCTFSARKTLAQKVSGFKKKKKKKVDLNTLI